MSQRKTLALLFSDIKKPLFALLALLFLYTGYLFFSYLNVSSKLEVDIMQDVSNTAVGPILEGMQIGQTFKATSETVDGISILFATYARENDAVITVGLREVGQNADIQTWKLNASEIEDNLFNDFILDSPISGNNKEYYFYVKSSSTEEGNAITIWYNSKDVYSNGTYLNNFEVVKGDLCFKTYYRVSSILLIQQTIKKFFLGFSFIVICIMILCVLFIMAPEKSIFDRLVQYRYLVIVVIFTFLVINKLHGFSLNIWDEYLHGSNTTAEVNHIWGKERPIASDVWALTIPLFFNQVDAGFPFHNYNIMANGANAVLYGLPVLDITVIGRPSQWGFLLLGKEMGLSWFYWFRLFGLFMTSFEIGLFLTRGHKKIALIGSLCIVLSPITQWWSGHVLPEILLYVQMVICGGLYYLQNWGSIKRKLTAAIIVLISGIGFVLLFSPSLQVPLGILVVIFAAGAIWEYKDSIQLKIHDIAIIAGTICLALGVIGHFVYLSWDDLQLYMSTAYPGARFLTGGEYNINYAFYHIFQWVLPFRNALWSNNCEVSTMIPFIPIVLIVTPFLLKYEKERKVFYTVLYSYLLFCISWMLVQFPEFIAKATLFYNVPMTRLMWTVGVLGVYFGMICTHSILKNKPFTRKHALTIATILSVVFIYIIRKSPASEYIRPYYIICVIVTLVTYFIFHIMFILGYKKLLAILLSIALLICGATVMPLNRGADSLVSRSLSSEVKQISASDPNALWVFNAVYPYGNYLVAQGLRVFNATNYYPDYDKWRVIDSEGRWEDMYNRYAQVSVQMANQQPSIELLSPDHIKVILNTQNLLDLGIDYIVSRDSLDYLDSDCLVEIRHIDKEHIWIYHMEP